jgi:4-amino-4-deoxy-L-arabinose transferase-like glycosyltransferase
MAQRGMFSDGLVYATIARNMGIGAGSLWAPTYTQTAWTEYYEHPPLGLALEAVAFRALGDHLVVERLYSLLVLALHGVAIVAIWRRLLPGGGLEWLAVLFWLTPSVVSWGAVNNMLENTQALLTTTAVLLMLDATRAPTAAATVIGSTVAGVAVVAAVLTKGPAGFFPLAAPLVFRWLLLAPAASPAERRRRALAVVTPILVVLVAGAMLAAYEPSRHNLTMYVRTQLAPSMLGQREVSDRLGLVRHLLVGIVGRMVALLGLCWWLARPACGSTPTPSARTAAGAFMLLGACAAGPFAFSARLSGHYLLPAVPMFALGFALLAAAFVDARVRKTLIGVTLLAVVVLASRRDRRDDALIRDLAAIEHAMPRAVLIGACPHPRAALDWGLHSYVQRWYRVSLDARAQPVNGWFLRSDPGCAVPESCAPAASGESLTLFRCAQ